MLKRRLSTEELIEILVSQHRPVAPRRKAIEGLLLGVGGAAVAYFILSLGPSRADLPVQEGNPLFLVSVAASALIWIAGVIALILLRGPQRPGRWLLWPIGASLFWLAVEFVGVVADLSSNGSAAFAFASSPECPLVIVGLGVPAFAALLLVARDAVRLWKVPAVGAAAVAAASLPASILNLFHTLDSAAMVLLWHGTTVGALTGAALLAAHRRLQQPSAGSRLPP
jgi:hypothetical protein